MRTLLTSPALSALVLGAMALAAVPANADGVTGGTFSPSPSGAHKASELLPRGTVFPLPANKIVEISMPAFR
ncbi:hypothetical protein GCM10010302_17000 [Streptomyces polychromogenes]|uniref:Uncharacterized protein n=1 Tax=Streptomyces polychromogenes TaxID=67342 RepID=A0ABN0V7V8_9ACTN